MNKKIIFALLLLSLTTIFCAFQPGALVSPTPDENTVGNATPTVMAFVTDTLIPTSTPAVQATGSISGHLSFPSDFIPPLRVVAFDGVNTSIYYYVDTALNQIDYTITGLPAGVYHIVSYPRPGASGAGYTQMVPCGLAYGCNDHSLIDVIVTAGQTTSGIDPGDWYADEGAFPPMPNP